MYWLNRSREVCSVLCFVHYMCYLQYSTDKIYNKAKLPTLSKLKTKFLKVTRVESGFTQCYTFENIGDFEASFVRPFQKLKLQFSRILQSNLQWCLSSYTEVWVCCILCMQRELCHMTYSNSLVHACQLQYCMYSEHWAVKREQPVLSKYWILFLGSTQYP